MATPRPHSSREQGGALTRAGCPSFGLIAVAGRPSAQARRVRLPGHLLLEGLSRATRDALRRTFVLVHVRVGGVSCTWTVAWRPQ